MFVHIRFAFERFRTVGASVQILSRVRGNVLLNDEKYTIIENILAWQYWMDECLMDKPSMPLLVWTLCHTNDISESYSCERCWCALSMRFDSVTLFRISDTADSDLMVDGPFSYACARIAHFCTIGRIRDNWPWAPPHHCVTSDARADWTLNCTLLRKCDTPVGPVARARLSHGLHADCVWWSCVNGESFGIIQLNRGQCHWFVLFGIYRFPQISHSNCRWALPCDVSICAKMPQRNENFFLQMSHSNRLGRCMRWCDFNCFFSVNRLPQSSHLWNRMRRASKDIGIRGVKLRLLEHIQDVTHLKVFGFEWYWIWPRTSDSRTRRWQQRTNNEYLLCWFR